MDILRKYAVIVISGAISVLALVGIGLGASRFSAAQSRLDQAKIVQERINSADQGVKVKTAEGTVKHIIPTEKLLEKFRTVAAARLFETVRTRREALRRNIGYDPTTGKTKRQVLLKGIFPNPTGAASYGFCRAYREAIQALLGQLNAGSPPTQEDIANHLEQLHRVLGFHAELSKPSGASDQGAAISLTDEDKRLHAKQQAAMDKAKSITIYAGINSLDVLSDVCATESGRPHGLDMMWWAQMSLWIQQDIVAAVAELNESADNVLSAPVKRLVKIGIQHGYSMSPASGGGFYGLVDRSDRGLSFAGIEANEFYDVMSFDLDMVIDVRQIPLLIDAIYRQGHYLVYQWDIEAEKTEQSEQRRSSRGDQNHLYRYGSDPIVRFTSSWQTYLFRDFYHWGIVDYKEVDDQGNFVVQLYDCNTVVVPDFDRRKGVKGLEGLMPETIRVELTGGETTQSPRRPLRRGKKQ